MRTIALALLPIVAAFGAGCRDDGDATLIVRNEGLHWASLTVRATFTRTDTEGNESWDEECITAELKPGHAFTRSFSTVPSVRVEVARLGDGFVVFSERYDAGDFRGPDNELEIVVRP